MTSSIIKDGGSNLSQLVLCSLLTLSDQQQLSSRADCQSANLTANTSSYFLLETSDNHRGTARG